MNYKELIKDFEPVTLVKFKMYLSKHLLNCCCEKNSNSKVVSAFKAKSNTCKFCGYKLYKNGKTKTGIQKYICSHCKCTHSETTDTVIYHSILPFSVWANVIDNLIDRISLRRIAEQKQYFS